jgi:hypothetical protein
MRAIRQRRTDYTRLCDHAFTDRNGETLVIVRAAVGAAALAAVTVLGSAGPGLADEQPAGVGPAASTSLRLGAEQGAAAKADYVNHSAAARTVTFFVDGPAAEAGVEVSPQKATFAPGQRTAVVLRATRALRKPVDGTLVSLDAAAGTATRRPIAGGPGAAVSTTTKSWTPAITPHLWQSSSRFEAPRLQGLTCPGPVELRAELWRGTDWAPLTVRCEGGSPVAELDHMTPFQAGAYTGTLTVGDDDVAVTVTRTADPVAPLVVMLVGILLAARIRAISAWRPVKAVEGEVDEKLEPPAGGPQKWQPWVETQVTETKGEILDTLPGRGSNHRWRLLRWLCAPPAGVQEQVASAREHRDGGAGDRRLDRHR